MASSSTLHVLSTISLAAGVGRIIAEQADNHFVKDIGLALQKSATHAITNWPGAVNIGQKKFDLLLKKYVAMWQTQFFKDGSKEDILEACSMLGLGLSDINAKLTHPKKKALIGNVVTAIGTLHNFFEPQEVGPEVLELYERGEKYIQAWNAAAQNH